MTDWSLAQRIEQEIAGIISRQAQAGWQFDTDLAKQRLAWLQEQQDILYDRIRPMLSKEVEVEGTGLVKKPFKKDGTYAAIVHRWLDSLDIDEFGRPDVTGQFTRVHFVEPGLSSVPKLKKQLLRLGWEPDEYTDKGNPKLTESSLVALNDQTGRDIARWHVYGHRASLIASQLLPNVRGDGRIPADAIPLGTNTGRMTHRIVVNIPKAADSVIYGREIRELFITKPGYVLVGHDAKGLELRFLAEFIGNIEYIEVIVNGDAHSHHQQMARLPERDDAKTFILNNRMLQG